VNPVGAGLAVAASLAVCGCAAALIGPARPRAAIVGGLTCLSGAGGAIAGAAALAGTRLTVTAPAVLPTVGGLVFVADALSGWFLLLIGAVTAIVGIYTIGYARPAGHGAGSRPALALLPLFTTSMLMVPVASSVPTLLVAWELMAVSSLLLVLAEHRGRETVRTAGIWYAAMTQGGFISILLGALWLSVAAGASTFAGIRAAPGLPAGAAGGVFVLCAVGFAAKAGAVPLHPWLPRAHAEAPSHVSALMSAAMVKLGVYGLLRFGFDLLGGGVRWWWLLVAGVGALSALYGIIQAVVARDIKRLLAFSTSENIGLILIGIGFAGLFAGAGNQVAASLVLAAALLHSINHAAFKTLLFAGAGSIVRATGTRDLDRLGGLIRPMPATAALISIGALAAATLPPGNGFVSEWLLLQALLHTGGQAGTVLTISAPLAVGVIALTAGVGVATFVKLVGTGLLARPRSAAAAGAVEAPVSMRIAMGIAAAACAALAVVPAVVVPALTRVANDLDLGAAPIRPDPLALRLTGVSATMWPLWLALGLVVLTAMIAVTARWWGRERRHAIPWDCGDGPLTARMEYTATSFAEPLQRVFDDVLTPERDVDVTHAAESAYHVEAISYQQRIPDRIEDRLYRPLLDLVQRIGVVARGLASGSMHRYLAYMLTALIAVLVAGVLR
jgi:formate hydrogenlyase subunit 3/multisubunit Na+/H+ antiporter MnhD subunit